MSRRRERPPARSPSAVAGLPFTVRGDRVEIRLDQCPWAGVDEEGNVWVSPSLSEAVDGYSAGKVEVAGDHVILRGGL